MFKCVWFISSYAVTQNYTLAQESQLESLFFFFSCERVGSGHKTRAQPVHVGGLKMTDYIRSA